MMISRIVAIMLVIVWLLYFSKAVFSIIKGLLYWLVYKPAEQITKLLFGD